MIFNPSRITIHCTDTKNGLPVSVETIDQWHKDRGWTGIGYHFVIQPDGRIDDGRKITKMGAHVEGANEDNIGVVLCGRNKYTIEQFKSLRELSGELMDRFNIDPWEIYTHAQWASALKQGKTCPNISINRLLCFLFTDNTDTIKDNILGDL
ncbi:MAG: N-acetylmuramoyl-L-alanine amidase [Thiofilum sp.]|uniref:N-acetylmuramoyl-L-alanine amidase n=1 Tax=Thiofilum sp. TaxID=2212733 RepID=UPI0025FEF518|nr:N-acetylmuramoyl-L-alanine amidase [Thiofilum sp.]MBK8455620.1 N-acetylmuramoyl-L-alanine amidase [Thiofilum sp.]